MILEEGEAYIYYIEIIRYIDRKLDGVWRVRIKEKVKDVNKFRVQMEKEINSKLTNDIIVELGVVHRLTKKK